MTSNLGSSCSVGGFFGVGSGIRFSVKQFGGLVDIDDANLASTYSYGVHSQPLDIKILSFLSESIQYLGPKQLKSCRKGLKNLKLYPWLRQSTNQLEPYVYAVIFGGPDPNLETT